MAEHKELFALPLTCEELIEHLDKKFAARCIRPAETLADAHRIAGARDLVDYLIDLRDNPEDEPKLLETRNVLSA